MTNLGPLQYDFLIIHAATWTAEIRRKRFYVKLMAI
jgi:hypothetical protein